MKDEFFPEAEPINMQMSPALELVYPINRCTSLTATDNA